MLPDGFFGFKMTVFSSREAIFGKSKSSPDPPIVFKIKEGPLKLPKPVFCNLYLPKRIKIFRFHFKKISNITSRRLKSGWGWLAVTQPYQPSTGSSSGG